MRGKERNQHFGSKIHASLRRTRKRRSSISHLAEESKSQRNQHGQPVEGEEMPASYTPLGTRFASSRFHPCKCPLRFRVGQWLNGLQTGAPGGALGNPHARPLRGCGTLQGSRAPSRPLPGHPGPVLGHFAQAISGRPAGREPMCCAGFNKLPSDWFLAAFCRVSRRMHHIDRLQVHSAVIQSLQIYG